MLALTAIELASATVAKSLPPNKLAAFGDSSMSGITAIQNDRSEPYLHALRTMPTGAASPAASSSQSFRREPQLRGSRKPADTARAFDEVGASAADHLADPGPGSPVSLTLGVGAIVVGPGSADWPATAGSQERGSAEEGEGRIINA